MLIPCPHCGDRDLGEFTYVGAADRTRPDPDAPQSAWCDYIYGRDNPMGAHREHWQHTGGCRAVLTVERDTLTHDIRTARIAGAWDAPDPSPAVDVAEPAE